MGEEVSGSSTAINSSNIGFKLLKKHGWKEGSGLGIAEQGRLEPIPTYVKNNKRGLGAEKGKKKTSKSVEASDAECKNEEKPPAKKSKASKRMRKMQELERRLQETEFDQAFRREFWPDNV